MRYLRILINPIKLKGDADDTETLQHDLYEKIQAMIEAETLAWSIDEEEEDEELDF